MNEESEILQPLSEVYFKELFQIRRENNLPDGSQESPGSISIDYGGVGIYSRPDIAHIRGIHK